MGIVTPSTYVDYVYSRDRIPNPVEYKEVLHNSWPKKRDRRHVLRYLYQLLMSDAPFGYKKMVVEGKTGAGKTCLASPFLALIPRRCVASIVNDGKFGAHQITEETRVVLMEEWNDG